jgi:hypothetical protein
VAASSASISAGQSTTITVSGGSGTYTSAYASEGSIYQSSNNVFTYTAAASPTTSSVTITVYDSAGQVGYGYVGISGTTTSTSSTYSCGGTYTADISGISATLTLVHGSGDYVAGYFYMYNYYYPVVGSCVFNGSSGTINVSDLINGYTYSGTVGLSGSQVAMSGSIVAAGYTYSWTATSQSSVASISVPSTTCQGTYSATIAGNAGTIALVQNGSNNVAGYMLLQGYYYALQGTCTPGGSISFTNLTSQSTYSGTSTLSGTATSSMSGTFYATNGSTYSWSATRQ